MVEGERDCSRSKSERVGIMFITFLIIATIYYVINACGIYMAIKNNGQANVYMNEKALNVAFFVSILTAVLFWCCVLLLLGGTV